MNGIDTLTTRPDLASRALVLNLPPIPPEARRCEEDVKAEFEAAWPGILGALLDAASAALANDSHVTLTGHPRMADVARWVVAAEPALGWTPGSFRAAYEVNQTESADTGLESDPLGLALLGLLRHASTVTGADASIPDLGQPHASVVWQGTATDLLNALESRVSDRTLRSRESRFAGGAHQPHAPTGSRPPRTRIPGREAKERQRAPRLHLVPAPGCGAQ